MNKGTSSLPFNVQGVAVGDKLVRVPMPTDSSLISQFREASAATAHAQGLFRFSHRRTERS